MEKIKVNIKHQYSCDNKVLIMLFDQYQLIKKLCNNNGLDPVYYQSTYFNLCNYIKKEMESKNVIALEKIKENGVTKICITEFDHKGSNVFYDFHQEENGDVYLTERRGKNAKNKNVNK